MGMGGHGHGHGHGHGYGHPMLGSASHSAFPHQLWGQSLPNATIIHFRMSSLVVSVILGYFLAVLPTIESIIARVDHHLVLKWYTNTSNLLVALCIQLFQCSDVCGIFS
jgi:hypothetical protein